MGEQPTANTHIHKHTVSLVIHMADGGSGQESHPILMHVGVANPLINLLGYEHRGKQWGQGGAGNGKHTHTNTHAHTVSLVIHRVVGASGKQRTQS